MPDNLGVRTGVDATVATDDIAGVHYQILKLADGAADSTTPITRAELTLPHVGRVVDENGNVLTVKSARKIDQAVGSATLAVGTVGKKIRVLAYRLSTGGANPTGAKLRDNAATPEVYARMAHSNRGTMVATAPAGGYEFELPDGLALVFEVDSNDTGSAAVVYVEAPV